jgi:hypothetical protein
MSLADYERAAALIRAHAAEADFVGPRPAELVAAAEARLGLTFPESYRRFLREFGAGAIGSVEVYGVINADFDHSATPDAIWDTLGLRAMFNLPTNLIPIHDLGDGDTYFLDCAVPGAEGPVIVYHPGLAPHEQPPGPAAADFGAFLLELVQLALDIRYGQRR